MATVKADVRPANPDPVVSAEADQRMAMDAMTIAQAARERVRQDMMNEATDATWWSWRQRVDNADRAVDRAVARVVEAAKDVCRARATSWVEA